MLTRLRWSCLGFVALTLLPACSPSDEGGTDETPATGGAAGSDHGIGGGAAGSDTGGSDTGGSDTGGGGATGGLGGLGGMGGGCASGDTRPGSTACGLNERGFFTEECDDGTWTDTTTCSDPDVCEDGTVQTLTDVCGLKGAGDIEQTCENGGWIDGICIDPDECTDGDTQTIGTCLGGSGVLEQSCVGDTWAAPQCTLTSMGRVNVSSDGDEGSSGRNPSVAWRGLYVAFESGASNLVPLDTNGTIDIFVHAVATGTTTRVSVATDGTEGNFPSYEPSISADGRYVAFWSYSSTLVNGDTKWKNDVFVHDRDTGVTSRISVASDGTEGNDDSFAPAISADGRYVAFTSTATNLVSGDTNGRKDVFVHDRVTGVTSRASVNGAGVQGNGDASDPSISADGRYVAFTSNSDTLVASDKNAKEDIFVRDREAEVTSLVSVDGGGSQGDGHSGEPHISSDGRFVVFNSLSTNLATDMVEDTNGIWDVFVHDRTTKSTSHVSVDSSGELANGGSGGATISDDGRFVSFVSDATNLVSGDTNSAQDIFARDLVVGSTVRVSVSSAGIQGNALSIESRLSSDGGYVAFSSLASNLVSGDTNAELDVFITPLIGTP